MNKTLALLLALESLAAAAPLQTRPLTLQQAIELALQQNPDYLLARLDEQKAREGVREARSPFVPRIAVGSGLAYSSGFPLSIEGAAPSIVQAQGSQFLYNRPQRFKVREAGEMAAAAGHSTAAKADEIAFRVASTYLDFERATRAVAAAARQLDTLARIEGLVGERVQAGREIPLELTKARVETARARARLAQLQAGAEVLEETLRSDLGLDESARISPLETSLPAQATLPADDNAAAGLALASSREIKRLESLLEARRLQVQGEKAGAHPRVDLVAQYALLGRFNNYEDFFRAFERHNGQVGVSVQFPLFARGQIAPRVAQAETEAAQTKLRLAAARSGVGLAARRLFREVRAADSARDLARLELDLARESLSVLLARLDEGRVSVAEVEQARLGEGVQWEVFYDAQTAAGKARLALLRHTGGLLAALR